MATTFLGQKVYNVSSYETLSVKSLTKRELSMINRIVLEPHTKFSGDKDLQAVVYLKNNTKVYFKVDFSLQDISFIGREISPESVKISTKSNPNKPEIIPFKVLSGYLK